MIPAKFIHLRVDAKLHDAFMGVVDRAQNETATGILTQFMEAEVARRQRKARQNAVSRATEPVGAVEDSGVDV
jgi:hypothetical protein